MRSLRALTPGLLVLGLLALALAACTGAAPGWTYAPAPPATPVPSFDAGVASAPPESEASAEASAPASQEPGGATGGTVLNLSAQNIAYDQSTLTVPAGQPFQIVFANNDAGIPHNVAIHEGTPTGPEVWKGDIFNGVETRTYDVPALAAGVYGFVCTVHPNMVGTLTAE